jgi:hypothetical protein
VYRCEACRPLFGVPQGSAGLASCHRLSAQFNGSKGGQCSEHLRVGGPRAAEWVEPEPVAPYGRWSGAGLAPFTPPSRGPALPRLLGAAGAFLLVSIRLGGLRFLDFADFS